MGPTNLFQLTTGQQSFTFSKNVCDDAPEISWGLSTSHCTADEATAESAQDSWLTQHVSSFSNYFFSSGKQLVQENESSNETLKAYEHVFKERDRIDCGKVLNIALITAVTVAVPLLQIASMFQ